MTYSRKDDRGCILEVTGTFVSLTIILNDLMIVCITHCMESKFLSAGCKFWDSFFNTVNELETEGRLAIESPTTPITVAPDTFDLGRWWNVLWFEIYKLYTNDGHVQTMDMNKHVHVHESIAMAMYA